MYGYVEMILETAAAVLICLGIVVIFPSWRKARSPMVTQEPIRHKFPQDPILVKLLDSPHRQSQSSPTVIHDVTYGFEKTYAELLDDILQTVHRLRNALPPSMLDEGGVFHVLRDDCSPYIGILVKSGYEFIVAFFAIRAIGGACMPIGKSPRFIQLSCSYYSDS